MNNVIEFSEYKNTDGEFSYRLIRLRKSLDKINCLMSDLQAMRVDETQLSYSNKKTLIKYCDLIKGDRPWTKGEIGGFKSLVQRALSGWERNEEYKKAILDLWQLFVEVDKEHSITAKQSSDGALWLWNFLFKKNGDPRETQTRYWFGGYEDRVMRNFSHFTFVGYHVEYNGPGKYSTKYLMGPIYRVHAVDGESFDYCVPGRWEAPLVDRQLCVND